MVLFTPGKHIVILMLCISLAFGNCPARCASAKNPNSERYFIQFFFKANWFRASQFCRYIGMDLATIASASEQTALSDQLLSIGMEKEDYWIGSNDLAHEGDFSWSSNGRRLTYTNWQTGNPSNSNGGEHCVHLHTNLKWNDNDCKKDMYFVCEKQTY